MTTFLDIYLPDQTGLAVLDELRRNGKTVEAIMVTAAEHPGPRTARAVAEGTGVSRGTARRYLEYLEQQGQARLELRYGSTGRPEHLYSAPIADP